MGTWYGYGGGGWHNGVVKERERKRKKTDRWADPGSGVQLVVVRRHWRMEPSWQRRWDLKSRPGPNKN
jgi:hypothetical protein